MEANASADPKSSVAASSLNASSGSPGLPASFFRPRLKRATVTYGGKRRSSISKNALSLRKPSAAASALGGEDELEVRDMRPWWRINTNKQRNAVAKRVKRKKPEFKVAQDDFVVDLKAFSELAISKKPSAGGTLALRDKSNALFLPKLNLSSKKPFLNRVGDAPQPFSTFSTSYDQPNPPLSPKSPNHRGKSFAALQSTPARDVGPSSVLPSPGLGSGIFSNPSGNLHEETMRIERIPDASTHTSLGRESVKAIGKERKPSQDSTTSGEEDLENDGTLADLLKESLAIKERKFGLARSSSSSFLPKAPIYPATGPLTAQSSESNMERLASDDLPPVKPAVPTARSQMQKKKKSALKVANTGSLKSRKSRPKEVSFSSGGEAGPSSARKKRSSSVPVAKSKGYDKEGRPTKSMKGSIIRDVAIKAESSASADELAL